MVNSVLYSKEILDSVAAEADSVMDMISLLGKKQTGSLHNYISRLIKIYEVDTSHFTYKKKNSDRTFVKRKPEDVLIVLTDPLSPRQKGHILTKALKQVGVPYKCSVCTLTEWQGKPLSLDVDHVDGNYLDCRKENLRFLCPNCHRQTPTFGQGKLKLSNPVDIRKTCSCRKPKTVKAKVCAHCFSSNRKMNTSQFEKKVKPKNNKGKPAPLKIVWPSDKELINDLQLTNYSTLSRKLGVSDNAIRKHLKYAGFDPKTLLKIE